MPYGVRGGLAWRAGVRSSHMSGPKEGADGFRRLSRRQEHAVL